MHWTRRNVPCAAFTLSDNPSAWGRFVIFPVLFYSLWFFCPQVCACMFHLANGHSEPRRVCSRDIFFFACSKYSFLHSFSVKNVIVYSFYVTSTVNFFFFWHSSNAYNCLLHVNPTLSVHGFVIFIRIRAFFVPFHNHWCQRSHLTSKCARFALLANMVFLIDIHKRVHFM